MWRLAAVSGRFLPSGFRFQHFNFQLLASRQSSNVRRVFCWREVIWIRAAGIGGAAFSVVTGRTYGLLGAVRIPVPKPVREPNRCNLEPFKSETPKTTLYLVLAQGRLTLQVVGLGLAHFRLAVWPPKSPPRRARTIPTRAGSPALLLICVMRGSDHFIAWNRLSRGRLGGPIFYAIQSWERIIVRIPDLPGFHSLRRRFGSPAQWRSRSSNSGLGVWYRVPVFGVSCTERSDQGALWAEDMLKERDVLLPYLCREP